MKRVLFVDDDAALLDGLRARLHTLNSQWQMVFVESASRALTELELGPFDVIVTDVRMPAMDGIALLEIVRDRWPETIRIVLSGYAEATRSARLLSVVHQYICKPCEPDELENVIRRCMRLRALFDEPRLRAVVGRVAHLPAMPRTCTNLRDAMANPDVSVCEIARIVCEDPAVAAKVLQLVNSAFFRLARRITSVEHAIGYLGFNAIRTLVMSVEVFRAWPDELSAFGLTPARLQERAHATAAATRALAAGTEFADDALLAGLLHNIGYWVLLQECREGLQSAISMARTHGIPLHAAEQAVIGASSAVIGAYLLGVWGLPYSIIEAVAFQHSPQLVGQSRFDVLAALVMAKSLQNPEEMLVTGVFERPDVRVDAGYLRALRAPFSWTEAQRRVESHGESCIDV